MTHEFKKIISLYKHAVAQNIKAVLATVVLVEGSSYRREGVRMLILENNKTIGAVSGGCVEKEVVYQSQSVFKTGTTKLMTYDGRYRLGCEGTLYILLEKFELTLNEIEQIELLFTNRKSFSIQSQFSKENSNGLGSFLLNGVAEKIFFSKQVPKEQMSTFSVFKQELKPCFQLLIVGAEHDANRLCKMASITGWEVTVVASPKHMKTDKDFPGIYKLIHADPESFDAKTIDSETAVVLMTHNYAKDVLFLKAMKDTSPAYVGLLGPQKRREQLLNAFIEYHPEVDTEFLDIIHGPTGLNIGAETPEEIAISIIAEILAFVKKAQVISLKDKKGQVHA